MLKVLDLFSGIGGFSLGLERTGGFETAAFCEIEEFPRKVLAKHWPDVPIYNDVRELTVDRLEADGLGRIDIICGGYPCQPFSQAGKRLGAEDDRHLWPEVKRLMATVRPTWGLFENVAGHISMGLDEVLSDLADEGYAAWPCVIPACAVDAPHRRDRVWIMAYRESKCSDGGECKKHGGTGIQIKTRTICRAMADTGRKHERSKVSGFSNKSINGEAQGKPTASRDGFANSGENVSNTNSARLEGQRKIASGVKPKLNNASNPCRWLAEPAVGRVAHGIPRRVDRLKGLGNAVVPQIPEMIGRAILESK